MLDAIRKFPRILVVDDDEAILSLISEMLTNEPYSLLAASTGYEALIKAQTFLPSLVLLDINLEGQISGLETCTQLKSRSETLNIPILFVSGHSDLLSESYRRGGTGFLLKPFSKSDLCELIEYHLEDVTPQFAEI